MAKIRGVKPEFWTDETVVEASIPARLLFIGLWNFACDNGHLDDKPKQIKMRVMPSDECNVAELLRELDSLGLIERSDGVITVPTLSRHQRPDRRYWLTCEAPGCTHPDPDSQHKPRRAHAVATTGARRAHKGDTVGAHVDGEGDGDGDGDNSSTPAPAVAAFDAFWAEYPRKEGKGAARKAWLKAVKTSEADAIQTGLQAQLPKFAATDRKFIPMPATWLNQERWTDEITNPKPTGTQGWWSM